MKTPALRLLLTIAIFVFYAQAQGADWNAIAKSPAEITVLQMQPQPLTVSADEDGWARIPAMLSQHGAVVFMTPNKYLGVADIQVTADGYLLIACNWDYQGNSSGDWDKEVWDERKFRSKGWDKLTKGELGGDLIKSKNNRVQTLFFKRVKKGDSFRLRCNKYDPPFPILLRGKP